MFVDVCGCLWMLVFNAWRSLSLSEGGLVVRMPRLSEGRKEARREGGKKGS